MCLSVMLIIPLFTYLVRNKCVLYASLSANILFELMESFTYIKADNRILMYFPSTYRVNK